MHRQGLEWEGRRKVRREERRERRKETGGKKKGKMEKGDRAKRAEVRRKDGDRESRRIRMRDGYLWEKGRIEGETEQGEGQRKL